jgi:hypothetical protein
VVEDVELVDLAEIRDQVVDVAAEALDFAVLGLVVIEDVDVDYRAVLGEAGGNLFAEDEVRAGTEAIHQGEAAVDGVVIGDRHVVHPAGLRAAIEILRLAQGVVDEAGQPAQGLVRKRRVAVQVDPHARTLVKTHALPAFAAGSVFEKGRQHVTHLLQLQCRYGWHCGEGL